MTEGGKKMATTEAETKVEGPEAPATSLVRREPLPRELAELGVKAAGGIRTYADVIKMVEAGATRVGCSASVKILEEAQQMASGKG